MPATASPGWGTTASLRIQIKSTSQAIRSGVMICPAAAERLYSGTDHHSATCRTKRESRTKEKIRRPVPLQGEVAPETAECAGVPPSAREV